MTPIKKAKHLVTGRVGWISTGILVPALMCLTAIDYQQSVMLDPWMLLALVLGTWILAAILTGLLFAMLFNAGRIWNSVLRRISQREEKTVHPAVAPKQEVKK